MLVKVMNGVAICTGLDGTLGKSSIEIETCFCLEEKNPIEKVLFRWIPLGTKFCNFIEVQKCITISANFDDKHVSQLPLICSEPKMFDQNDNFKKTSNPS